MATNNLLIIYINVDSLANKLQELKTLMSNISPKLKVVALTEVKHKSKWSANLSEFNISGCNIFSNDLSCNSRGIIVYVSQDLACKLVNVNVNFSEFLLLQVTGVFAHNKSMLIGIIYRSPNSVTENDLKLFELINTICSDNKNNLLLVGDFN